MKTKIVATIGPAVGSREMLRALISAGLSVARLNFSHGEYPTFTQWIKDIRELSKEMGKPVAILQDLQGPKIRVGEMNENVVITAGKKVTFTTKKVKGTDKLIPIQYQNMPRDVKSGDTIFLDDGLLQISVLKTNKKDTIQAKVLVGGPLSSHKGMNLPNTSISTPGISEKDRRDIKFGLEQDVDFIALSFVRTSKDIKTLKEMIRKAGKRAQVFAKMERREGIEKLEEIMEETDGVMVARGDLGIEVSLEEVPLLQKKIINMAIQKGKPVITATQMLDSMIRNPKPTRAEVSDVANAILDGTDAVMLSGESAVGKYPLQAVRMLGSIAREVEKTSLAQKQMERASLISRLKRQNATLTEALSVAAEELADHAQADAIIVATMTGYTARMMAKQRPHAKIIAYSPDKKIVAQMAVLWNTTPRLLPSFREEEDVLEQALDSAVAEGLVKPGDKVVLTAGTPTRVAGTTNTLQIHIVDKIRIPFRHRQ